MKKKSIKTYISIFSSAGVGCYAFKKNGFSCIATNEIIERRLNIQRINNKCKYDTGYISGDITLKSTQDKVLKEIEFWQKNEGIDSVDVLMATPPCQGMSTANYKKGDEINRNSLVVEAIHLVNKIKPRVFVFENVRAFLTTMCVDKDDEKLSIDDCIKKNLSSDYNVYAKVVNFCDYGIPSSRPRTLVIGTLKTEKNFSPLNLFPLKTKQCNVREAIGDLKSLQFGQCDKKDLYHSFRTYPEYMQSWIRDLKEGETAFNNPDNNKPYRIVAGKKQILKSGFMGNKFCRMYWDKPAPCITTRNDQLASQSTIHPRDNRVLSIRELMRVMTIPDDFKWTLEYEKKQIDDAETLIRQSIGEAVPTKIIDIIANNINIMLEYDSFIINNKQDRYIGKNPYILTYLYEKNLSNAKNTGSFYTPQSVVYNTICGYNTKSKCIKVLEPAVGVGAFIPQFLRLIDDCENVEFDLFDISDECIKELKTINRLFHFNSKFKFKYFCSDFLTYDFKEKKYDVIISNPPYYKMNSKLKKQYKEYFNIKTENIFCYFLDKYLKLSDEILCVIPKVFIMIPDCNDVRLKIQNDYRVLSLIDYGVKYFKEVFIEIISLHINKDFNNKIKTHIVNCLENIDKYVDYSYIYHDKCWIIYRNEWFDKYIKTLKLDYFDYYRDRQLTNRYLKDKGKIWVVRSKNLLDDGTVVHKVGYDKYVDTLDGFQLNKFYGRENIIFTNFTYNTRATVLQKDCIVNGSFCILIPKDKVKKEQLKIFATEDFRKYYAIVKNLSKFTINVDANSIYYIGVKEND